MEETKGILLKRMDDRLLEVDREGCTFGKVLDTKVVHLTDTTKSIQETLCKLDAKMTMIIVLGTILSLFAGGNFFDSLLKVATQLIR